MPHDRLIGHDLGMTDIELIGGPLDGMAFPDGGILPDEPGAYMIVPEANTEARAIYEPIEQDQPHRWHFGGWATG